MTAVQDRPGPYPPVMMPGTGEIATAVTAVLTVPLPPRRDSGLCEARLTDLNGRLLYRGWVPVGARVVMRGARVFMHYDRDEWRQIPVVELGQDGRPL